MNVSCRACLSEEVLLYTNEETETNGIFSGLLETFKALTGFDTHPIYLGGVFNLCKPCEEKLKLCYEFRELCLQSYSKLEIEFIKVEVDQGEEVPVEDYSDFDLIGDDDEIETVENYDSQIEKCEDKDLSVNKNKRLEVFSEETVQNLIDEAFTMSNELNKCVSCDFIAEKFVYLRPHMVEDHPDIKDNWCNKCNQLVDPLKEHIHRKNMLTCKLCGKNVDNRSHLINHYRAHTDTRKFNCDQCDKSYTTKSGLDVHYKSHDNATYNCKFCNSSYKHPSSLRKHLLKTKHYRGDLQNGCKTVNFDNPEVVNSNEVFENAMETETSSDFKNDCEKSYTSSSHLDVNYKSHKNETYNCKFCPNSYSHPASLRRHLLKANHSDEEVQVDCKACNKKFKNHEDLEKHDCINQAENSNNVPEFVAVKTEIPNDLKLKGDKKFQCDQCDRSYTTKPHLEVHYKSHLNETYKCNFCPNTYAHPTSLRRHLLKAGHLHKNCETCNNKFKSQEDFEKHDCSNQVLNSNDPIKMETSSDSNLDKSQKIKKYLCNVCGNQFRKASGLKQHMEIHAGVKPFKCQYCGYRTRLKSLLKNHVRTHTGEKPYKCNVCLKTFSQRSSLNLHVKTHQGDLGKPYACKLCEKRFCRKIDLQYHMRLHTGEKPYRCMHCPMAFNQSCNLKYHIETHSDVRPYICGYCGSGFKAKSTLKNHELIHTGEKPYKCNICSISFRKMNHLTVHMKRHKK